MRFKAIEGSQGGHTCCFRATVVDTTTEPDLSDGVRRYAAVCETFNMDTAMLIAGSLNLLFRSMPAEAIGQLAAEGPPIPN